MNLNPCLVSRFRGIALLLVLITLSLTTAPAQDKAPLNLEFPAPTLKGTPEDLPKGPNFEPLPTKAPTPLQIPKPAKNVALGKTVTSSVKPFTGELEQITDGQKGAFDYDTVEMKKGAQWVQVDLGATYELHAIAMWHDHRYIQSYYGVVVQVANDPEFKEKTTLFNNDTENATAQGVGTDRQYFETHFGKVIDGKATKARYLRCYTKGSSNSALNCWQEIEVYAVPAK
jgi:hypothetical protein